MLRKSSVAVGLLLAVSVASGDGRCPVVERWKPEGVATREYTSVLVVGITKDLETRKRFEDKLVVHLRGRGVRSTTSHSIVADLAAPGDPSAIADRLLEREVDAVITVRLIPAEDAPGGAFADLWSTGAREELRVRPYVASALAAANPGAKRFVVEIGLWDMTSRARVWAARTEAHKLSRLRKASGAIMQETIDALKSDRLF